MGMKRYRNQASSSARAMERVHRVCIRNRVVSRRRVATLGTSTFAAVFLAIFAIPQFAVGQTTTSAATPSPAPTLSMTLGPSLRQVHAALGQIQIGHWKVSRQWKAQLQNDADSIQQDLAAQLPVLLQKADVSPMDLQPQLTAMRNVDALYDVLVRVSTTANLSAGRDDASALANALQQLEGARKAASDNLLKAAAQQDQEVVRLRTTAQTTRAGNRESEHPKRIVVDNDAHYRARHHRKISHAKKTVKPNPATQQGPSSKPNPEK